MTKVGGLRALIGAMATPTKASSERNRFTRYSLAAAIFCAGILGVCLLLHRLAQHSSGHYSGISHSRQRSGRRYSPITLDLSNVAHIALETDAEVARARNPNCSYWDCFNVYKCGHGNADRMSVYVYPLQTFVDANTLAGASSLSKEFYFILKAIVDSPYYTPDPNEACVFVPSIDLMNQNRVHAGLAAKALASLEHWENGENHLLFNMVPGVAPDFNTSLDVQTDLAMVAGSGFDTWSYRPGFDLSIPFFNPTLVDEDRPNPGRNGEDRPFLLISSQLNLYARHTRILQELTYDHPDLLVLQKCPTESQSTTHETTNRHSSEAKSHQTDAIKDVRCSFTNQLQMRYPKVLRTGVFCLVARGIRLVQLNLLEVLASGCIPVVMADNVVMPFNEIIDWTLAVITIRETNLHSLIAVLQSVSTDRIAELQRQGRWLYAQYFSSLPRIVGTVLDELNDRIFPHLARDYRHWNIPVTKLSTQNPLFLQLTAPKSPGFTAVILTYDRVESLFTLIEKLSVVPSLQKILVIWNNQKKAPPHLSVFPKIAKPLNVIRTKSNKLSHRFYPYEDIETEAILTIDDDIVMLTADELDFGYEVWREFPDRIVGFPSRTHVWDNSTGRWRYESEWTNEISMVLTGAAFHHKYWSHMYTNAMPGDIKDWVDEHMNCEDIAMNFLVANITGKPPIKVAPRKKFKCPECTNTEMLSADLNHMLERSACIDRFAGIYGRMPLRTVEFRADPVLFKDNFPEKLKRFNDIGSL